MSRNSWYKSDEHVKKRNIMKMKLWRKKVMKHIKDEVVEKNNEKSDEHKVVVDARNV